MISGLIGTIVFLFVMGLFASFIVKITDFVIGLITLAGIVLIFYAGVEGSFSDAMLTGLLLAILVPVITLPLWPFSSFGKEMLESNPSSVLQAWKEFAMALVELVKTIVVGLIGFFSSLGKEDEKPSSEIEEG